LGGALQQGRLGVSIVVKKYFVGVLQMALPNKSPQPTPKSGAAELYR